MLPKALLFLAAAAPAALAWSCNGHMLVTQIALDSNLMSSATVQAVTKLAAFLNNQYPYSGNTVMGVSCWADDVRGQEPATAGWHFIDIPVCHLSDPTGCTPPLPNDNAVWAIDTAESTLEAAGAAQLERARQLRFLLHFVGDVHQPLHAADYFSSQFPTGDRGGNSWPIAGALPATNLHSFWDQGLGQWTQNLQRPLNATGKAWLSSLSERVRALHPVAELQPFINQRNASDWAAQSNDIAATFTYTAPQAPTPIPKGYTSQGQALVLKQVAIAGYRLAAALELLFSSDPKDLIFAHVQAARQ